MELAGLGEQANERNGQMGQMHAMGALRKEALMKHTTHMSYSKENMKFNRNLLLCPCTQWELKCPQRSISYEVDYRENVLKRMNTP